MWLLYQFPKHIVISVSPVIAGRASRGVRKYNWRPRVSQSVKHCLLCNVRDVYHHSQPVHLEHDSLRENINSKLQRLLFQLDFILPFQNHSVRFQVAQKHCRHVLPQDPFCHCKQLQPCNKERKVVFTFLDQNQGCTSYFHTMELGNCG